MYFSCIQSSNHNLPSHSLFLLPYYFADLLNYLDPGIDPCEDFYEYACGGWIKKNPLPNQKEEWNQFTKLEEKSNQFIRKILQTKETQAEYSKVSTTFLLPNANLHGKEWGTSSIITKKPIWRRLWRPKACIPSGRQAIQVQNVTLQHIPSNRIQWVFVAF